MLTAFIWITAAIGLALWSLLVYAFHALGQWSLQAVAQSGAPLEQAGTEAIRQALPAWVPAGWAEWVEPLLQSASSALGLLSATLPWMATGIDVIAWLSWAVGSAVVVLLALLAQTALGRLWPRPRAAG